MRNYFLAIEDISIGIPEDQRSRTTIASVYNPNEDDLKRAEIENPLAYKRLD